MALSDRRITALGKKYKAHKTAAGAENKEAKRISRKILDEFERRETKSITGDDGVKVTYVQSSSVVYDEAAILDSLTPSQRKQCTRTVLDISTLSLLVQNGKVDASVVDDNSSLRFNAPYISVTLPGEE